MWAHKELAQIQIRSGFQLSFPKNRFDWFDELDSIHFYASNDAIHLTANSAKRYSLALVERVSQLKQMIKK